MKRKNVKYRYFILNKPYGVLCQFTDTMGRKTLSDIGNFPVNVYPVGRLDFDSEGLVFLTDDGKMKNFLLEPKNKHPRTYLVQLENVPDEKSLMRLRNGIKIKDYFTQPAYVVLLKDEPDIPPREKPIRQRKSIPTSWLKMTLYEGKNRQVRRMTAAIGYPTLRLIRIKMGPLSLGKLLPGEFRELNDHEIRNLRKYLFG